MKIQEKDPEESEDPNRYISSQRSIIINLKREKVLSNQLHIEPLSKAEENEVNMYIIKAQEIVTKWNERLKNE